MRFLSDENNGKWIEATANFGEAFASTTYSKIYKADQAFKIANRGPKDYWSSAANPETPILLLFKFNQLQRVTKIKFEEYKKYKQDADYEVHCVVLAKSTDKVHKLYY